MSSTRGPASCSPLAGAASASSLRPAGACAGGSGAPLSSWVPLGTLVRALRWLPSPDGCAGSGCSGGGCSGCDGGDGGCGCSCGCSCGGDVGCLRANSAAACWRHASAFLSSWCAVCLSPSRTLAAARAAAAAAASVAGCWGRPPPLALASRGRPPPLALPLHGLASGSAASAAAASLPLRRGGGGLRLAHAAAALLKAFSH
jgi:hypothetical protein